MFQCGRVLWERVMSAVSLFPFSGVRDAKLYAGYQTELEVR